MLQANPYLRNKSVTQYQTTSVSTASPQKLILMLYDGGIRFANMAKGHLSQKNYKEYGEYLIKTQRIFAELKKSLDHRYNAELSGNLERLYEYIDYQLAQAVYKKDPTLIDDALKVILDLREAWAQICTMSEAELEASRNKALAANE